MNSDVIDGPTKLGRSLLTFCMKWHVVRSFAKLCLCFWFIVHNFAARDYVVATDVKRRRAFEAENNFPSP